MQAHALDRKRGPGLEPRTEKESIKYTAERWSKDSKQRALGERSGNSHTLPKLHNETEVDHEGPLPRRPQA